MALTLYDEDRLPWLDDVPRHSPGAATASAPFGRNVAKGAAAGALALALVATLVVLVSVLLNGGWSAGPIALRPPVEAEEKAAAVSADVDACTEICAQLGNASGPAPAEIAGAAELRSGERESGTIDGAQDAPAAQDSSIQLQLGAYRSRAAAQRGWGYLSGRFSLLRRYPTIVAQSTGGEDAFFRLRLVVPTEKEARELCTLMRRGGEDCFLVHRVEE